MKPQPLKQVDSPGAVLGNWEEQLSAQGDDVLVPLGRPPSTVQKLAKLSPTALQEPTRMCRSADFCLCPSLKSAILSLCAGLSLQLSSLPHDCLQTICFSLSLLSSFLLWAAAKNPAYRPWSFLSKLSKICPRASFSFHLSINLLTRVRTENRPFQFPGYHLASNTRISTGSSNR